MDSSRSFVDPWFFQGVVETAFIKLRFTPHPWRLAGSFAALQAFEQSDRFWRPHLLCHLIPGPCLCGIGGKTSHVKRIKKIRIIARAISSRRPLSAHGPLSVHATINTCSLAICLPSLTNPRPAAESATGGQPCRRYIRAQTRRL